MRERPIRSGDEPIHARSPLRLRLILALLGVAWSAGGAVVFILNDTPVLAAGFGIVAVIAVIDSVVVVGHLRAGAHYQPGPDVPPYRPVEPFAPARPPHLPIAPGVRLHRYLALMSVCLILLVLAWTWVRLFSTGLAIAMTLVAMVIPPIAAIVANAGALEDQERHQRDDAEHSADGRADGAGDGHGEGSAGR